MEASRLDKFHFLCAAQDPVTGERYSENSLKAEAIMLIVAGSDSVSSPLSGFWFYISRNQSAYEKLKAEIRSTFKSPNDITNDSKLASCAYLFACIEETLRMVPAGTSEMPREVLPGGTTINGEYFPPGVVVGCCNWAMGRNEEVFGDPSRFRPERYLPSEARGVTIEDVNRIKSCYHPFLLGPTNCPGKSIAMAEIALVIAKTLYRLDLRAVPVGGLGAGHPRLGLGRREKGQYQIMDAYIAVRDGPVLQFKPRGA
jgi:cytochrome P450